MEDSKRHFKFKNVNPGPLHTSSFVSLLLLFMLLLYVDLGICNWKYFICNFCMTCIIHACLFLLHYTFFSKMRMRDDF